MDRGWRWSLCSPPTRGWTGDTVRTRRVPRLRGDGPRVPRLRGDGPGEPRDVFPAYAGMDRSRVLTDGDRAGCSPPTRGWTGLEGHSARRSGQRVPRLRGDGPVSAAPTCSPPTRGWTVVELVRVPRLRGDGPGRCPRLRSVTWADADISCSPPTRGWTASVPCPVFPRLRMDRQFQVFPAYAGMDRQERPCVPRLRGDGPSDEDTVFPAYAGMDHFRGQMPE